MLTQFELESYGRSGPGSLRKVLARSLWNAARTRVRNFDFRARRGKASRQVEVRPVDAAARSVASM